MLANSLRRLAAICSPLCRRIWHSQIALIFHPIARRRRAFRRSKHVAADLLRPVGAIARRHASFQAAMAVPETALYLYDKMVFSKHDIGTSRQFRIMQPEAIAETMKRAPNSDLGFSILGADKRHHLGALLWSENISHWLSRVGFVVSLVAPLEFLLKPFEDGSLVIQRRATNLLKEFNPRRLRKGSVLQALVAISAFRAQVSKYRLAALGEVYDVPDREPDRAV